MFSYTLATGRADISGAISTEHLIC